MSIIGDRAQEAEDARRAARVADVDVHAILLGDLDIVPPDVRAAGQDGGQHHIGIAQRFGPVQGRIDFGGIVAQGDDLLHRAPGEIEPLGVDVHQRKVGIFQQRKGEICRGRARG